MLIPEVLRLHPPIPILEKRCTNTTHLSLNNGQSVLVEKDTPLAIPVYSIHRDAEFYTNPEAFDPDRFASGADHFRRSGVFLPFGSGPRQCLGLKYALALAKVLLCEIVINFQIDASDKTRLPIVMNPDAYLNDPPKLWAELRPRHQ
jgi:cytochrome P450